MNTTTNTTTDTTATDATMRETGVPFPGFYCSRLDAMCDDAVELDATGEEEDGTYGDATCADICAAINDAITWHDVHVDIAREYVDVFADMVERETSRALRLEFSEMTSPREYNFTTDRISARIPLDVLRMLKDQTSELTLRETIRARHTSHDGFISFYTNDADAWHAKPLDQWDVNECETLLRAWINDNVDPHHAADGVSYIEDITTEQLDEYVRNTVGGAWNERDVRESLARNA